jgi:hypothetical protein
MNKTVNEMVNTIDSVNAEYILADHRFNEMVERMEYYKARGQEDMVDYMFIRLDEVAREYNERNLTPANVQVGDGVTLRLYSDRHAYTVIKKTKTTITVQRDIATLAKDWKPEVSIGGFAGHCTNNDSQEYTYEQNPEGQTEVFRWSKKYGCFKNGSYTLGKGRHEKYDYNF